MCLSCDPEFVSLPRRLFRGRCVIRLFWHRGDPTKMRRVPSQTDHSAL